MHRAIIIIFAEAVASSAGATSAVASEVAVAKVITQADPITVNLVPSQATSGANSKIMGYHSKRTSRATRHNSSSITLIRGLSREPKPMVTTTMDSRSIKLDGAALLRPIMKPYITVTRGHSS